MYHHSVTFLGILTRGFADRVKVLFPCLCMIFHPSTLEIVTPDKTDKITYSRAHFILVKKSKPFYGFDIVWVKYKNAFRGFGVIPTSRAKLF